MSGRLWHGLLIILGTLNEKKLQPVYCLRATEEPHRAEPDTVQFGYSAGCLEETKKATVNGPGTDRFFLVQTTESSGYNCCDVEENVKLVW